MQVLAIDGMHCDACVRRVTQALGSLPGVRVESVKIGEARVLAEPACDEEIRGAIASAGFNVTDLHASS
ncbi:heavy-metal-associated domain-containing protein [Acidipila sp. EB88]|nr:heavy-metal-associated domain-containing protein [Acidipila sp. EB88]